MEGLQANSGLPQNPPKQHFEDKNNKFMVGQGGIGHQQSGGNWTAPLPHLCFWIPGWHMHSQKVKWCFWDVELNRILGIIGQTSHTNVTSALHVLQNACCWNYKKANQQPSGMDETNWLWWHW